MQPNNDFYAIVYSQDEIGIRPTSCKNPGLCTCVVDESSAPKCGYSAEQARRYIIAYYKRRIEYLEKITINDFLHDQGYYG